ncbi:GIY-YIG nuclease family protein [Natronoflexus pectinivorans]|uniref:Putative endonuclease n=1 Tax=Natronoflexus pectinivorans TaxID=682526 RepID=A0A4R2GIV6_9BACT|nr:GIY-YIG nuclease family protein [Natronoflexus pectinivorans]TCO08458.1 putative endonuclease [Natronoflexus pectinivorans]
MIYSVYILYSDTSDRYYIGHTGNVEKRLYEHNNPEVQTKYTSKYLPWRIVAHIEVSQDRGEAMKLERFIKQQKSRNFIESLIANQKDIEFIEKLMSSALSKSQ